MTTTKGTNFLNKKNILFSIFLLAIVYFFAKGIISNYSNLQEYHFSIHWGWMIGSIFIYLLWYISLTFLWSNLLPKIPHIPWRNIWHVNALSWISKYIPGKIPVIITKVIFVEKYGGDKTKGLLSSIYEQIFQLFTAGLLSLPFILYFGGEIFDSKWTIWISIGILVIFFIALSPYILSKFGYIWQKFFPSFSFDRSDFLGFFPLVKNTFFYTLSTLIKGASFVVMVMALTSITPSDMAYIAFAWICANIIGVLAFFAPGGIGVRDGTLVALLTPLFPFEVAIVFSIVSRIWTSVGDGIIGLTLLSTSKKSTKTT